MRILYVFRSLAIFGGIERILVDKMNYLADEYGYNVYMVTANQGSHPVPYKLSDSVVFEDLNIRFHDQYRYKGLHRVWDRYNRNSKFKKLLKLKIKQISPDVIVCVADGYQVLVTKVKGNIPLVVEAHNNYSYVYEGKGIVKKYMKWLQRRALYNVQALVTLTPQDAENWKRIIDNVFVIKNFVNINKSGIYSKLNNRRVVFVGRLEGQKRVFEILKIWQMVFPKHRDWSLDVYGDGDNYDEIERISCDMDVNIYIHRPTSDILKVYLESDFLVLTSEYEPFGLVMPEAMSCGLPVVSYDVPYGPALIISDGVDGFLIKDNDRLSFAQKMDMLMSDSALLEKMGRAAVLSSRSYSADKIMPQWKDLLDNISGNRL